MQGVGGGYKELGELLQGVGESCVVVAGMLSVLSIEESCGKQYSIKYFKLAGKENIDSSQSKIS